MSPTMAVRSERTCASWFALVSGYSAASRPEMASISAPAATRDTPGLRRPITWKNRESRTAVTFVKGNPLGMPCSPSVQRSAWAKKWKSSGMMPITEYGRSFSVIAVPSTAGFDANRRRQSCSLKTTSRPAPDRSSAGRNVRPRSAVAPSSVKKLPETDMLTSRSG